MSAAVHGHPTPRTPPSTPSPPQHGVAAERFVPPLVVAGAVFEGQVAVRGETRIDGLVRGAVTGSGCLVLGPDARIEGRVECEEVRCEGTILGRITVTKRLVLGAGAILEGDLEAPIVQMADTAIWNGHAHVGT